MNFYHFVLIVCILTVVIVAIVTAKLILKKRQKGNSEIANRANDPKVIEQNIKNADFVCKIIRGTEGVSEKVKINAIVWFPLWQNTQNELFGDAPKDRLKLRNKLIKENKLDQFSAYYSDHAPDESVVNPDNNVVMSPELAREPFTLFMGDVFTEPFPSLHDMDTWAMKTQFADICILKGLDTHKDDYFIHKKHHFVNHSMVRGIIQFDIYKRIN